MDLPLIKLENISRTFAPDHNTGIRDVNLEIRAGEFVAIVGPSGAGKAPCSISSGCSPAPTLVDTPLVVVKHTNSMTANAINYDHCSLDSFFNQHLSSPMNPQSRTQHWVFEFNAPPRGNAVIGHGEPWNCSE